MAVPETTGVKNAGGITRFMRETKVELKKVTWPTKQELIANTCLLYTSPSPRDGLLSRMPSSA